MHFSALVDHVSTETGLSKGDASSVVRTVLSSIEIGLAQDQNVRLAGFGTFSICHTSPRTGRNPKTGEPVPIAAAQKIVFRPAQKLKEATKADR